MRIRWDYERSHWIILSGEINDDEMNLLYNQYIEPNFLDNWTSGDVYYYHKDCPIGEIIDIFHKNDLPLEILY